MTIEVDADDGNDDSEAMPETEVTPEMAEAGVAALEKSRGIIGDQALVVEIYRAMNAKVLPHKDEWMWNPLIDDERDPEPYDS